MNPIHPEQSGSETGLTAAWIILMIIILPNVPLGKLGGGSAMVVASLAGMVVYALGNPHRQPSEKRRWLWLAGMASLTGLTIALIITYIFPR